MKNNQSVYGKRVLVTGGAGVIGCELLRMLVYEGAQVLSIDRNPLPRGNWEGVTHLQRDLVTDALEEMLNFRPEIVFHLAAAFERSEESPDFWEMNWHDNIMLSHRLLNFVKKASDLKVFIFASSYLVYSPSLYLSASPLGDVVFLKEEDLKEPRNLCGAAKYYTERELEFIKKVVNPSLRIVFARIFRVYGFGSKDVISRWVRAALLGQDIEVYNKENRFDFVFAKDVAEGLLRLSANPDAEGPINLGSGVPRSINDILSILGEYLPTAQLRIRDLGSLEPFEASGADVTRLKRLTGWVPSIDLEKGIGSIVEFERAKGGCI